MTTPQSGGPQPGLVSPLVLDDPPPAAATAVLTDEQDRRVVLVELRLNPGAVPAEVQRQFEDLFASTFTGADAPPQPQLVGRHYLRCKLTPTEVQRLVSGGSSPTSRQARRARDLIFHVWPDLVVDAHLDRSLTTIKADAAERTYGCGGGGIVWGVLDSGINEHHPHFARYATLAADAVKGLHQDFSLRPPGVPDAPLVDVVGHGTHVAGIIAGCAPTDPASLRIAVNEPTAQDFPLWAPRTLAPGTTLSGVAPKANLVSLRCSTITARRCQA